MLDMWKWKIFCNGDFFKKSNGRFISHMFKRYILHNGTCDLNLNEWWRRIHVKKNPDLFYGTSTFVVNWSTLCHIQLYKSKF